MDGLTVGGQGLDGQGEAGAVEDGLDIIDYDLLPPTLPSVHLAIRGPGHAVHGAVVGGQGGPQHPRLGPDLHRPVLATSHNTSSVPAPSESQNLLIPGVNLYSSVVTNCDIQLNTEHLPNIFNFGKCPRK